MAGVRVSRRACSLIILVGLAILAARAAQQIVEHAVHPSGYITGQESYRYPADAVTWWLRMIAAEFVIASWFVWRARRLSVTTSALVLAFALACIPAMAICVDAPRYVLDHLLFLVFTTAWLLLAAVVAWTVRIVIYLRRARPSA